MDRKNNKNTEKNIDQTWETAKLINICVTEVPEKRREKTEQKQYLRRH